MSGATTSDRHRTRQAAILVGGRGTRLGERAARAPKPLMRIDEDTVFLDHLLFDVARQGFDDILLLSGHMGDQVRDRYDGRSIRGAQVRVVIEPEPAGTAGALVHARDLLRDTFLLANGDTLFDVNYRPLDVALMENAAAVGVLGMRRIADAGRYGRIEMDGARVVGFAEKDPDAAGREGLINAGVGLFRRSVLDRVDRLPCSIETTVYPGLVAEGALFGVELDGYFIDIGLPETLDRARIDLPARFRRPALFLDLAVVLDRGAEGGLGSGGLAWRPGVRETIRRAADLGALTIVVSRPAGEAARACLCGAMRDDLARCGAHVDAVFDAPRPRDAIAEALASWPVDVGASVAVGSGDGWAEASGLAGVRGVRFDGGDLAGVVGPLLDGMRRIGG